MDQLPHDFAARPHIIEPPQHRNSMPTPGYGEDRRSLFDSGRDHVSLESYTIARAPTYATAKRTRWNAKEDELRELVRKQQKRGTSAYVPLNKDSEIKHSRRSQVARLVQDRNSHTLNDPRTKYELAALKMEQFHTKDGADERLKVILRRRVRPGLPNDPSRPVTAPPPIPSSEIIDLTQSDDYERSSQSSYPSSPPLHVPGPGDFSLSGHPPPVHHGGQPGPQIFDHRFPQQPFGSPIGEEQPRPPHRDQVILDQEPGYFGGFGGKDNRPPHRDQVILDQQPDHFGGFGANGHHGNDHSENKKGKGDKSKGKQKQQRDESDSSTGSEAEIFSVDSDGTPLSTISSSRSSYRGDKRPLRGNPQPQFSTNGHGERHHGSREEKIYQKEGHRFAPGANDDESRGRGRGFEEKMYRHDDPKAGSSGHDRGNHGGGSKKDKSYYPDSHHRRSVSADRGDRGRNDKKEKKYRHESRRDSPSHERSEHSYKAEKRYRPESHSSKSDRHHRDYRQTATREHVRKVPVARPRGSWSDGSTSYTDEEYIIVPGNSSRRSHAAPQILVQEAPVRSRRALIDDEESLDYVPRPLGRSNTAYRPKLTNKPFRHVDLHDSRFDYARDAREKAEFQRQRDLELQREEEDRIVAQQVQDFLAKEDEEMIRQHQRRTEMAREDSRRRIAIKVREELQRAKLGRERPFDEYDLPLRARRASAVYDY